MREFYNILQVGKASMIQAQAPETREKINKFD